MSLTADARSAYWPEYWTELVELYEYKVRDLLDGRQPRGGRRSLGDLRDLLLSAPLDGQLMRRFAQADRQWKAHLHEIVQARVVAEDAAWAGDRPPDDSEQDTLEGLRFVVWREGVREQARSQALIWMREGDLVTLRCAYALDVNLERGDASMEVPRPNDALVSLGTPSVSSELMTHLADQLCAAFIEPPAHHPGARNQALIRLREAVNGLAVNPFPRHKDQDVTTARVQAAEREGLGPELTRTLIEGLQQEIGGPRPAAERLAIRGGVERLALFLESVIPVSEGGHGPELPPIPQVLYAAQPRFALSEPDDGSNSLTIRLSSAEGTESQTHWRGAAINWRRSRDGWMVAIGALEYRFYTRGQGTMPDPQTQFVPIVLGEQNGQALLHGEYVYLSARQNDRGLLELLALSRAVALLLDPGGAYLNLRLARAAAQRFRDGRIDLPGVNVVSAERYSAASPDALLTFARKGAEGLLIRLRQRPPQESEHVFRAAAEAVGAPEGHELHLLSALRRVQNPGKAYGSYGSAADPAPSDEPQPGVMQVTELQNSARVSGPGEMAMVEFSGEPLTVEVAGRALTLRLDYKGDLAVVLPGAPVTLLRELLVLDVAAGGLLLVRQGSRILLSYEPHLEVRQRGR